MKISSLIDNNQFLSNLIITGPSGTGKTSTILALAKKIYGKNYSESVMELNASDNRGLEFINNSIIYFCKKINISKEGKSVQKLIIMDEGDNITRKAQNMISNMIEEYALHTKFAFTCNDSSKLIESIQSRCILIFFPAHATEKIKLQLNNICNKENIDFDDSALTLLAMNACGDIRQAINNLEAIYYGFNKITEDNINKLCHQPNPDTIIDLIQSCANRDTKKSINILAILKQKGYCGNDILLTMINILTNVEIEEDIRLKYIRIISESYLQVSDGIISNLQLYGCISRLILLY